MILSSLKNLAKQQRGGFGRELPADETLFTSSFHPNMNLSKICSVLIMFFIADLKILFLRFILGNKTMD